MDETEIGIALENVLYIMMDKEHPIHQNDDMSTMTWTEIYDRLKNIKKHSEDFDLLDDIEVIENASKVIRNEENRTSIKDILYQLRDIAGHCENIYEDTQNMQEKMDWESENDPYGWRENAENINLTIKLIENIIA